MADDPNALDVSTRSVDELISMLYGSNVKYQADEAASELFRRRAFADVRRALLKRTIRKAKGRVRATWILNVHGNADPADIPVYEALIDDRSVDVLSNALFGIVFWRNKDSLPLLETALNRAKPDSERFRELSEAICALKADDPKLFSPHYRDQHGIWDRPAK